MIVSMVSNGVYRLGHHEGARIGLDPYPKALDRSMNKATNISTSAERLGAFYMTTFNAVLLPHSLLAQSIKYRNFDTTYQRVQK